MCSVNEMQSPCEYTAEPYVTGASNLPILISAARVVLRYQSSWWRSMKWFQCQVRASFAPPTAAAAKCTHPHMVFVFSQSLMILRCNLACRRVKSIFLGAWQRVSSATWISKKCKSTHLPGGGVDEPWKHGANSPYRFPARRQKRRQKKKTDRRRDTNGKHIPCYPSYDVPPMMSIFCINQHFVPN